MRHAHIETAVEEAFPYNLPSTDMLLTPPEWLP